MTNKKIVIAVLMFLLLTVTVVPQEAFADASSDALKGKTVIPTDFCEDYPAVGALRNITIPDQIKEIRKDAFDKYSYLQEVTIPGSVTQIDASAFIAPKLTKVTFLGGVPNCPDKAWTIFGDNHAALTIYCYSKEYNSFKKAFSGMNGVKIEKIVTARERDKAALEAAVAEKIRRAGSYNKLSTGATDSLSGIEYAYVPDGISHVEAATFIYFGNLKEVILPASVKHLGSGAFLGTPLQKIIFFGDVPDFWRGDGGLSNAKDFLGELNPTIYCTEPYYRSFRRAFAGYDVKIISSAFLRSKNDYFLELIGMDVTSPPLDPLSSDTTSLPHYKLTADEELTFAEIPEGIKYIPNECFLACYELEEVIIPASVTQIGALTFYDCSNLKSITFLGKCPETSYGSMPYLLLSDSDSPEEAVVYCFPSEIDAFDKAINRDRARPSSAQKVTIKSIYDKPESTRSEGDQTSTKYETLTQPGTWSGNGTLTGEIDALQSEFLGMTLDGKKVAESNYTTGNVAGATIIFTEDYLKTLSAGKHTFTAEFVDGTADLSLKVPIPSYVLWGGIAVLVIAGLVVFILMYRRRQRKHAGDQQASQEKTI